MWDDDAVEGGLSELRAATSVEELHRLLVTRWVSGRSGWHQEAVELFVHHHGDDPGGAIDTAALGARADPDASIRHWAPELEAGADAKTILF
jgi:hypothetical protein